MWLDAAELCLTRHEEIAMSTVAPIVTVPVNDTLSPEAAVPKLRFRAALDKVKPEAVLVDSTKLATINLDIPAAVIATIRAFRTIMLHREDIARHLPTFPIDKLDMLETYALAAGQAHAQYVLATGQIDSIPELSAQLTKMRDVLLADINVLGKRGIIDASRVDFLKGPQGFKNLAFDTMSIASLLRDHWSVIAGKTGLTLAELDAAETLADRLATAIAFRDEGGAGDAVDLRHRTFTLFVEAYDEVRRGLTYLRWHPGDLEQIAPSLYQGRGGRGKKDEAVEPIVVDEKPIVVEPAPVPAPVGGSTNGAKPGPGMPGNDPFANG